MIINLAKRFFHHQHRLIAKIWLKLHPQVRIIGITGSYGKTNTTKAVEAVLKKHFQVVTTDINLDTTYNLPITLLKINRQTRIAVLEYCVDKKNEMSQHLSLVKPYLGIITGITPVHSEKSMLGSLGGIIQEKGRLLEALLPSGKAILNFDDPYVAKMAPKTKCPVITYGSSPKFDYYFDKAIVTKKGTSFNAHFKKNGKTITRKIRLRLIGEYFAQEALAALAVADLFKIDTAAACQALEQLSPLSGRMSLEKGPKKTILINDYLRANPASTIAGLKTLATIKHNGPRIAVLGEMGELGKYQAQEHYRVGKTIAQLKNIDYVIVLGPATKKIIQGAVENGFSPKKIFYTSNHQEAAEKLKKLLAPGTLWYLKGSRLKHMERITLILSGIKVACRKISCHNYYHCSQCKELSQDTKNIN
jgi:UDP-N-acetylmuramoyl-tripeptide--D-alanyl-D-alanine ligase